MTSKRYEDEGEIREVVAKFENCQFGLEEFTHARHVTVACWYLCTMSQETALVQMRSGLQRFIAHHGRQGYHETITRFWMELLGDFLRGVPVEIDTVETINRAVASYAEKEILFQYYSREGVMSDAARREWMEPDVRSWRAAPFDVGDRVG